MADKFSKEKRSEIMSKISGEDTIPEMVVRKYLFNKGFRFKKNVKNLLGKPDIVLPKYRQIIFVHGCFWHGHENCRKSTLPTTNVQFWKNKIESNLIRDEFVRQALIREGWRVTIIWECMIKDQRRYEKFMMRLCDKLRKQLK